MREGAPERAGTLSPGMSSQEGSGLFAKSRLRSYGGKLAKSIGKGKDSPAGGEGPLGERLSRTVMALSVRLGMEILPLVSHHLSSHKSSCTALRQA